MCPKTLAEHVRAYLGLPTFLNECRADGVDTQPAPRAKGPRRILVAYDQSAPALWAVEVAARLAQDVGGAVMLVHVVRPATGAGGEYVSSLERLDALHHCEAHEMLARVRRTLPRSLEVDHVVRAGQPADEILAAAKAWNAEQIVLGTPARGRLAQFLLGSTAEVVIRRAACPVVTVGRRAAWAVDSKSNIASKEPATATT
jgi:nucleotide-binding universal stress UspA family protein